MKRTITRGKRYKALVIAVSTITAGLTTIPGVYAQEDLEEIQVTGSRIRATDGMATPTPVTALAIGELADFEPGGTVADQLDALPQFFGTQSAARGGGALFGSAGGSFLNMRSLGANRTLVLLDGSRVVPGDKAGSVNVETLPNALIRTVDVVTGGASAAYGADALGGVTNFVIDREFQGFKMSAGTGITEMGDGDRWNLSIAGGHQFGDRLNVIASYDERYMNQIERRPEDLDPDYFRRWGHVTNPAWISAAATPNVPRQLTLTDVCSSQHSPTGLIQQPGSALHRMKFTMDGQNITPFVSGDVVNLGGPGGTNSMSGGPECALANKAFGAGGGDAAEVIGRNVFVGVRYELTDSIEIYGQALGGRSESNNDNHRSSYELELPWQATIFRDNAFLPDSVAAVMDAEGRTSIRVDKNGSFYGVPEIGYDNRDHNVLTTQSWSVGFNAELPNGWDLSGNWQSGESAKRSQVYDKTRVDRMLLAMDAVRDPATGAIVCNVTLRNPSPAELAASPSVQGRFTSRSDTLNAIDPSVPREPLYSPIGLDNTVRDCVPYNVMGNGNISEAALDYVGTDKFGLGTIDQDFAELLLQGEAYEGWGYGPVSFATGFTWREQSFQDGAHPADVDDLGPPLNDPNLGIRGFPGGYAGGSANLHMFSTVPLIHGDLDVWEWFGELQAPIWESQSGQQSLGGSMAFRRSDYSRSGEVDSWKIGMEFEVFEDLRLRATKSRDIREPTFRELFDAQGGGGSVNDPVNGNANIQITSVAGGNPNLNPEIADTVVAGFVYQPSWLEGLSLSTDWYQIEIKDAIAQLGLQRVVDECHINNQIPLCGNIERNGAQLPGTNFREITRVFNYFLNVAQARVEGVDLEVAYRLEPNFFDSDIESLTVRALGGYIIERADTPLGGVPRDVSGGFGTPKWTANITTNYSVGPMSFQLQMRHIDQSLRNTTWVEGRDVDDNTVASSTWFNGQIGYNGETSNGANWNVALNVQNLFNRNPPIIASFGSRGGSQLESDNYDTLGRRYQLSVNYTF
jgi:outer membrane receptor protein involved in Fe transport